MKVEYKLVCSTPHKTEDGIEHWADGVTEKYLNELAGLGWRLHSVNWKEEEMFSVVLVKETGIGKFGI